MIVWFRIHLLLHWPPAGRVGLGVTVNVAAWCLGQVQTPSTGLRHPSFSAGKRCWECGASPRLLLQKTVVAKLQVDVVYYTSTTAGCDKTWPLHWLLPQAWQGWAVVYMGSSSHWVKAEVISGHSSEIPNLAKGWFIDCLCHCIVSKEVAVMVY